MIRIFIADDHSLFVEGIKQMLSEESDFECVGTASDGRLAQHLIPQYEIDILLLDINMPEISGIEVCKWVKQKFPQIKVLALTMLDKSSFIQQMMKAGASGYLLKDTNKPEFIKAIREIFKGETYIGEAVQKSLVNQVFNPNESSQSFIPELTRREKQILNLIAREFTTAEISDSLSISLNTVETHRRNLLSKLNARNSAGMIRIAMEKGLLDS